MVIPQEYPNIRVKNIDVDLLENGSGHESAADLVMGEILDSDSRLFVVHRKAQRWVQTYEPVETSNTGESGWTFREGGVYLITGGLGRIGVAISEFLAEKYRASLVLVGRSRLPGRASWDSWVAGRTPEDPVCAKIRIIERIEKLGGHVLYVNANVSDVNAMRGVIEQAYQCYGTLHGVIHGAGIVGDDGYCEIKDSDHENCDAHFQAKAHGLLVLEEVLQDKPLDFCLLMSSLTSVLGGIGQAAYASSNIYMDSFVRRHNRTSPVPWLSVNWDVWRLQDQDAIASGLGTTLKELGMSAAEATEMMETALAVKTASQLVVSTGDLGARIDQWIKLESLNPKQSAAASSPDRSGFSQRPALQTHYDAPNDETEEHIARVWADALGINEVGINDNFSELGGHSLIAIRIVSELRKVFQIDLPVRALFEAPTVATLSSYVKQHLIAEIEALSEDEARLLVSGE